MTDRPTGLTAIQAGHLLADVEHMGKTLDEHSKILKRINDKLDDRVTRDEFEKYKQEHKQEVLEDYIRRSEIAGLIHLWSFLTTGVMKLLSRVILWGVVLAITFNVVQEVPAWVYKIENKAIHRAKEE